MGIGARAADPAWSESGGGRRVGERDGAGSAELATEVFALVYKQMRALTACRSRDLDDLVQIAAERALRALDSFEGRADLSTWTYRICYRTLLTHQRSHGRWLRRFILDNETVEAADESLGADESLEQHERARRLRAALASLSPKHRAVVVLHDLEGLSVVEIAEVVSAKHNTVRSRLRDGRRALSRALADDPYFGEEACRSGGDE